MTFAQFCRIETTAGGCLCTHREFIKAAHGLLSTDGKSRFFRDERHAWLREGLQMLDKSAAEYETIYPER